MVWKIYKDGRRRKAVTRQCLHCKSSFTTLYTEIKKGYGKFCSTACSFKHRTRVVSFKCAVCKTVFVRQSSAIKKSKSGLRFCSKKCKGQAQHIRVGFEQMLPSHYGTGNTHYREKFVGCVMKCSRCGYAEFACSVEVHHKDGNRANNASDNSCLLCANCHRSLHLDLWKSASVPSVATGSVS